MPDYVYVGSAPLWDWYARASLGEEKIAGCAPRPATTPTTRPGRAARAMSRRSAPLLLAAAAPW